MKQVVTGEGTHSKRRENHPSPAPHISKEVVDRMLGCDPGDDDNAQFGHGRRKSSSLIGLKNCLEGVIEDT